MKTKKRESRSDLRDHVIFVLATNGRSVLSLISFRSFSSLSLSVPFSVLPSLSPPSRILSLALPLSVDFVLLLSLLVSYHPFCSIYLTVAKINHPYFCQHWSSNKTTQHLFYMTIAGSWSNWRECLFRERWRERWRPTPSFVFLP